MMIEVDGGKQQAGTGDRSVELVFALLDDLFDRSLRVGLFTVTDNC